MELGHQFLQIYVVYLLRKLEHVYPDVKQKISLFTQNVKNGKMGKRRFFDRFYCPERFEKSRLARISGFVTPGGKCG
jgi:hypothetical protein